MIHLRQRPEKRIRRAGADPDFVEDFSSYTGSEPFFATVTAYGIWSAIGSTEGGTVALDTGNGVNINGWALSQSMRYTFRDMTAEVDATNPATEGRCDNHYIQRTIAVGTATLTAIQTAPVVWIETYVMWATNWDTFTPSAWGCTNLPDHKLLLAHPHPDGVLPGKRWQVKDGWGYDPSVTNTAIWHVGCPSTNDSQSDSYCNQAGATLLSARTSWDAAWHRIRLKCFNNVGGTKGLKVWLDNTLLHSIENAGIPDAVTGINRIDVGANRNRGTSGEQSFWWGLIRVWYSGDPLWD